MLLFIVYCAKELFFLSKQTAKQDVNEAMINGCNQSCHRSIAPFSTWRLNVYCTQWLSRSCSKVSLENVTILGCKWHISIKWHAVISWTTCADWFNIAYSTLCTVSLFGFFFFPSLFTPHPPPPPKEILQNTIFVQLWGEHIGPHLFISSKGQDTESTTRRQRRELVMGEENMASRMLYSDRT